jgi:hypothetical protein
MSEVVVSNSELSKHSQWVEQDSLLMKERLIQLQLQVDDLRANMPKKAALKMDKAKRLAEEKGIGEDAARAAVAAKGESRCLIC